MNAAFGNIDQNDNWKWNFVDTYLEGFEIGDPKLIEIMSKETKSRIN